MHARCTVQKAFFTMKAQRTRGDALSIVQASGRWVREAGARAMRVWLRRRARTFVLWAWRVWLLEITEQRRANQRRLSTNMNLVQGASRLERTLKRWRFSALALCLRTWLDHASAAVGCDDCGSAQETGQAAAILEKPHKPCSLALAHEEMREVRLIQLPK